jgi:hypothetical protein
LTRVRQITIFRYTNPGDNILNPGFTDKIVFNSSQDTKIQNAFIYSYKISPQRDVAKNPVPNIDLAEHQDTGFGDLVYEMSGGISQRDGGAVNGTNTFAALIKQWSEESSENTNFPYGRFGILLEDFAIYSFTPTSTTGLYFMSSPWEISLESDSEAPFVITLSKSKQ